MVKMTANNTKIKIAAFGAFPETVLTVASYPTGGIALLASLLGEDQFVATVNLSPYGSRPLADNEAWLKGWGENEGVPEAMARAGAVTLTGETMAAGYATAQLGLVSGEVMRARQEVRAQESGDEHECER